MGAYRRFTTHWRSSQDISGVLLASHLAATYLLLRLDFILDAEKLIQSLLLPLAELAHLNRELGSVECKLKHNKALDSSLVSPFSMALPSYLSPSQRLAAS